MLPHHITLCDITDKLCCNLYVSWEGSLLPDSCKDASGKRQSYYFPTPRRVSGEKVNIKSCLLSSYQSKISCRQSSLVTLNISEILEYMVI